MKNKAMDESEFRKQIIKELMFSGTKKEKVLAIQYYKEHVEGVPLTQDEVIQSFVEGFLCRDKEVNKTVLDLLNKYRSNLQDESRIKLGRTPNFEKEVSYRAYIKALIEIQNKLK